VLARSEESTKVLGSSVKILNFVISDMLDYAQLGAGQFRKSIEQIDLIESVEETVDILRYKAEELDISLNTYYQNIG